VYAANLVRQARHLGGPWHWRLRWGLAGGISEALSARGATVVAASDEAAADAARLYRARVAHVVPLGVDTEVFQPRNRGDARARLDLPAGERLALFVGRGEPGKGPHIALAACRRAGFTLLAAGARPPAGSRALGVLSRQELAWAYAAADVVVLPTRYEGFGYVAVEALACGVPIVTTPTGWARELWSAAASYRPLLVPPEPAAVAGALALVAGRTVQAAVHDARAHVLAHNSSAAFAHRFTAVLEEIGAVPAGVGATR
jgi:D-inositol-3-phosphate glycosyltransferase